MKNVYANQPVRGFTIVEPLITIVVIDVLAAVSVTAYTGIQNKAYNAAIMSDANQWEKVFHPYRVINGSYPLESDPNNGICVPLGQSQCDFTKTTASRYNNFYQGPIDRLKSVVGSLPKGGQPGGAKWIQLGWVYI